MEKMIDYIKINKLELLYFTILFFVFFIFSPLKYDLEYFGSVTGYEFVYEFVFGDLPHDQTNTEFILIGHLILLLMFCFWAAVFLMISNIFKDNNKKNNILKNLFILIILLIMSSYATFIASVVIMSIFL